MAADLHLHRAMGEVEEIFTPSVLNTLPGNSAIGHTRYSTAGDKALLNAQPILIDCNKGKVALGHNGNLTNAAEWRRKLEHRGSIFQTNSDTEVIVHLLARSQARNLSGALGDALNQVEGAYSLLVLTPDELYAVRDPRGFRPLNLGRLGDAWLVASETCAFDLLNAQYVREVEPGEMVRISRSGIESIRFAPEKPLQQCIFEHVYFSRPDSIIFGRSVNESREALGRLLAQEHPVDADIVVPVPDSGVPAAVGYSLESGIPFRMGLIRNHYIGRTFIEPSQAIRNFGVKLKLNPIRGLIEGKRVVLVDDSHRARHHQPQDRAHGAGSRRERSARAHQLPADDFAVLLRRGHADARRVDRVLEFTGRNSQISRRRFARIRVAGQFETSGERHQRQRSARLATLGCIPRIWCNSKWAKGTSNEVFRDATNGSRIEDPAAERPVTVERES